MSTGTRRPSLSRYPSVALERQSSITSHSSNAFFDEQEEISSSGRTNVAEREGIWNTTRRKLTLVSLCLVYFAATASFAILSPFFPSEVSYVLNYFSPKFRLRQVESQRRVPFRITALISMARGQQIGSLFFRRIKRISRATLIKNNRSKAYAGRKFGPGSIAYRHVWVAFDYVTFISEYQRSTQACVFI